MCIKRIKKQRQVRVEITFSHGSGYSTTPPKLVINIPIGQEFEQNIGADRLWEGDTLIKEFDWVAGFTRTYEYFYQ